MKKIIRLLLISIKDYLKENRQEYAPTLPYCTRVKFE